MPATGPWRIQSPDRGAIAENLAIQRLRGVSMAGIEFLPTSAGLAGGPFAMGYARREPNGALPFEIRPGLPPRAKAPSARPSSALVDLGLHLPPGIPAYARATRANAAEMTARLRELAATGTVLAHHSHRERETILVTDAGDGTAYAASIAACRQQDPTSWEAPGETGAERRRHSEAPIFAHVLREARLRVPAGGTAGMTYAQAAAALGIRPAWPGQCADVAETYRGGQSDAPLRRALAALIQILPSAALASLHATQVGLSSTAAVAPGAIPEGNPSQPSAARCRMVAHGLDAARRAEVAALESDPREAAILGAAAAWLRHEGHAWERDPAATGPGCRLDCLRPVPETGWAAATFASGSAAARAALRRAATGAEAAMASAADAAEILAIAGMR